MSFKTTREPNPRPPTEPEETAHQDDAVIGRATRWSLSILAVVLAIVAGLLFWFLRKPEAPPPRVTKLNAPVAPKARASAPSVRFVDITREGGLRFDRFNGATGEKLLPETMGGGVAFFDFDADGDPDLLLVNGAPWPWATNAPPTRPTHALYRNEGAGKFTDVTAGSGLDITSYGMGVACGDFDNDGLV